MDGVVDLDNIIQEEAEEDSHSTQPNDLDLERSNYFSIWHRPQGKFHYEA
jgi:hypothetical protein